jgi:hypothetical protein
MEDTPRDWILATRSLCDDTILASHLSTTVVESANYRIAYHELRLPLQTPTAGTVPLVFHHVPTDAKFYSGSWDWKARFSIDDGRPVQIFLPPETHYLFFFMDEMARRLLSENHPTVVESCGQPVNLLVTGKQPPSFAELFEALPSEIVLVFSEYLTLAELANFQLTCKAVHQKFRDCNVFEELALRKYLTQELATRRMDFVARSQLVGDVSLDRGHLGYKIVRPRWKAASGTGSGDLQVLENKLRDFGHLNCWALLTLWIPDSATRSPDSKISPNKKFATSDVLVLGAQFFGPDRLHVRAAYRAMGFDAIELVSAFGGSASYYWTVGKWHRVCGEIRECSSGLHYFADSHSAMTYAEMSGNVFVGRRIHGSFANSAETGNREQSEEKALQ